jgi:hypothetical protein
MVYILFEDFFKSISSKRFGHTFLEIIYLKIYKKQGHNMLEALTLSFRGTPLILAGAE